MTEQPDYEALKTEILKLNEIIDSQNQRFHEYQQLGRIGSWEWDLEQDSIRQGPVPAGTRPIDREWRERC